MKKSIKSSEVVEVKRESINFAGYNPRKSSDEVVKSLVKNFKSVGYLGGVVVNKKTGNIVSGHKRVEAMDHIHTTKGKLQEYTLRVELIDVDEKVEKEQNIYMNNSAQQGDFDFKKLAELAPDIDIDAAGLTDLQLDKIEVFSPTPKEIAPEEIEPERAELTPKEREARKADVKEAKQNTVDKGIEEHRNLTESHLIIVFPTYDKKAEFCEAYGLEIDRKIFSGDEFSRALGEEGD